MNCLLCLKINDSGQKSIIFDSTEWKELNIEYIIEKHLWKMENLNNHSYICQACWQELYNFHYFYLNIEKAQTNINIILKSEIVYDDVSIGEENLSEDIFINREKSCQQKALTNLNILNSESACDDVLSDEGGLSADFFIDRKEKPQLESEFLFLTEENPLEISEQKDVEEKSSFEKNPKCKRPLKKSAGDTKYIAENSPNKILKKEQSINEINYKPEDNKNPDKNGVKLKVVEKEDIGQVNHLEKGTTRKRSVLKNRNYKKNIGTTKINKLESNKNQDEVHIKLEKVENEVMERNTKSKSSVTKSTNDKKNIGTTETNEPDDSGDQYEVSIKLEEVEKEVMEKVSGLEKNTKRSVTKNTKKVTTEVNKREFNKNQDEVGKKLNEIKNCSKKGELDEHFSDQSDSSESDDDSSSSSAHLSKLEKLHKEQDKFIAENFPIICSLCDMPLASYDIMVTHYKDEHNQRGYATCCDQKLHSRPEIVDHIKFHLDPECFKCKQCNKITTGRASLKLHIKNVHGKRDFKCDICSRILATEKNLKMHKLLHDADSNEVPCKQCDKIFVSKRSLYNHMRLAHSNKYKICHLCGKSLFDNYLLKQHMLLEHEGKTKEKFICKVCGRILSSMSCLNRHMRYNHPPDGVRPELNCPECSRIFTSTVNLKAHIRRVHEKKYVRKCTLCEKEFKRSCALKDHMTLHTGKPLNACSFCPRTFNSNGNMHAHRKRAHPKEWQELVKKRFADLPEKHATKTKES